jgi:hypothetical protein
VLRCIGDTRCCSGVAPFGFLMRFKICLIIGSIYGCHGIIIRLLFSLHFCKLDHIPHSVL